MSCSDIEYAAMLATSLYGRGSLIASAEDSTCLLGFTLPKAWKRLGKAVRGVAGAVPEDVFVGNVGY